VVADTVRRQIGGTASHATHIDDIAADVRLRLIAKLWAIRRDDDGERGAIENLAAYAATAAEYACFTFFRQHYPERSRFKNRVRYAVSHHPGTRLDRDDHAWRCRTRRTRRRAPVPGATQAFLDDPRGWLDARGIDAAGLELATLLDRLLATLDAPILLDRLIDALAGVLGIVDAPPVTTSEDGGGMRQGRSHQPVDPAPAISDVMEQREALTAVWREIADLPPRQRAALLLNLRDPDGGAVLQLLPATGLVAMPDIASALGVDEAQLRAMWDALPLDDLSIAARLGITRQQVINLRKSARARLARRLGHT